MKCSWFGSSVFWRLFPFTGKPFNGGLHFINLSTLKITRDFKLFCYCELTELILKQHLGILCMCKWKLVKNIYLGFKNLFHLTNLSWISFNIKQNCQINNEKWNCRILLRGKTIYFHSIFLKMCLKELHLCKRFVVTSVYSCTSYKIENQMLIVYSGGNRSTL